MLIILTLVKEKIDISLKTKTSLQNFQTKFNFSRQFKFNLQKSKKKKIKTKRLLGTYLGSEFMRIKQRATFIWIDSGVFVNSYWIDVL